MGEHGDPWRSMVFDSMEESAPFLGNCTGGAQDRNVGSARVPHPAWDNSSCYHRSFVSLLNQEGPG